MGNFCNIIARKIHFRKYKEFFLGWIFLGFFGLLLGSAPGIPKIYYLWKTQEQVYCDEVLD